jgi:Glutathione peroxidase
MFAATQKYLHSGFSKIKSITTQIDINQQKLDSNSSLLNFESNSNDFNFQSKETLLERIYRHCIMTRFVAIFTLNLVILTIIVAWKPNYSQRPVVSSNRIVNLDFLPKKILDILQSSKASYIKAICTSSLIFGLSAPFVTNADTEITTPPAVVTSEVTKKVIDWEGFKLPYNHENVEFKTFLGKATILFNMKIDDPQTVTQFPSLLEIYQKYSDQGLNVLGYPTEQGWFEPDDDETCREKSKVYYGFGSYPHAVIFDKVCVITFCYVKSVH